MFKNVAAKDALDNLLLNAVSAVDPSCRQHSLSLKLMKDLPNLATNVISVEEREAYDLKVYHYHVAKLRQPEQKEPVDNWWVETKNSTRFPLLSRMACALLTCFHGPKVESSFSIMNAVITPGSNRLNVQSFDAIQTVKYELAAEFFLKGDFLHDPFDKNLCKNVRYACSSYRTEMVLKGRRSVLHNQVLQMKSCCQKRQQRSYQQKLKNYKEMSI
ncbi:hypothetical protein AVEN_76572-1 [Araneus ventricosus]|uniref:HAT C-terminal dimerisation domain-containing protein n=1 Tax=Araneus ventricosus TaxID=182803 RepID=A0A4Y2AIB4_ARAVE|nr:hypothetical protein AVEN_76572-1 [Araneus ventricosus]